MAKNLRQRLKAVCMSVRLLNVHDEMRLRDELVQQKILTLEESSDLANALSTIRQLSPKLSKISV